MLHVYVLVDFLDFVDVLIRSGVLEYVLLYGCLSPFYVCAWEDLGGLLCISAKRICVC